TVVWAETDLIRRRRLGRQFAFCSLGHSHTQRGKTKGVTRNGRRVVFAARGFSMLRAAACGGGGCAQGPVCGDLLRPVRPPCDEAAGPRGWALGPNRLMRFGSGRRREAVRLLRRARPHRRADRWRRLCHLRRRRGGRGPRARRPATRFPPIAALTSRPL